VSLLGDLLGLGLGVLREVAGAVTGNLYQDGATTAWTQGRIVSEVRQPDEGDRDRLERVLELQAAGITGVTPRADARLTFTGSSTRWRVVSADPIAPGGTTVAWRLVLEDFVNRSA
jgi:hypothetical protein